MILLSSAKFLNAVLPSLSSLYWKPALGSHNVDVTVLGTIKTVIEETSNNPTLTFKTISYLLFILVLIILSLYIFSLLLFSPGSGFHNIKVATHY